MDTPLALGGVSFCLELMPLRETDTCRYPRACETGDLVARRNEIATFRVKLLPSPNANLRAGGTGGQRFFPLALARILITARRGVTAGPRFLKNLVLICVACVS